MPLLTIMSPCSSCLSRVSLFSGSLSRPQTRARSPQPRPEPGARSLPGRPGTHACPREGCGFTYSPWLHPWVSVPGANQLAGTRRDGLTDVTPVVNPGHSSSDSQNPSPSLEPRSHPLQCLVLPILSETGSRLVLTLSERPLGAPNSILLGSQHLV